MPQLNLEIPEELIMLLRDRALAQNKSMEQMAIDELLSSFAPSGTPKAVLRVIDGIGPVDPRTVDELESAIAAARLGESSAERFQD